MRSQINFIASILLFAFLAKASILSPFLSAFDPWNDDIATNGTAHELFKRQSSACPTSYKACTNEGAPGLCCGSNQLCTADVRGYVACCPSGATCTGSITGIVTAGTILGGGGLATSTSNTNLLTSSALSTTTGTSNGLVLATATSTTAGASATSTQGFIIAASTTVATIGSRGSKSVAIPLYAHLIIKALEYLPL